MTYEKSWYPVQESKQVYIKNGSCRISREVDGVAVAGSGVTIEYCPLYSVTDGVQPLSAWNFATVGRKAPSPTQPLTVIGKNPHIPFTPPGVFSPYCTTKSSCRWTPELLISKCKSTTVQSATSGFLYDETMRIVSEQSARLFTFKGKRVEGQRTNLSEPFVGGDSLSNSRHC